MGRAHGKCKKLHGENPWRFLESVKTKGPDGTSKSKVSQSKSTIDRRCESIRMNAGHIPQHTSSVERQGFLSFFVCSHMLVVLVKHLT